MDPKSIIATLKEASLLDLFLVSFIALPFVFDAWIGVLEKLELGSTVKYISLAIVLVAYTFGVGLMYVGSSRRKLRETATHQIVNYLTSNSFKMMALETIRENIDSGYDDKFLNSLPVHYPNEIRRALLKGHKPGLARMVEEPSADEA